MKELESVGVAIDGDAKSGKTELIKTIAQEANFQAGIVPDLIAGMPQNGWSLGDDAASSLQELQDRFCFNNVSYIPAGNAFRAAALHVALLGMDGQQKNEFEHKDADAIRELLALDGVEGILQEDPNIAGLVSTVAKMAGVQALCGTIFCDSVVDAYKKDGGANLVIVDARDPIGHLRRNGALGSLTCQINPASIMPLYIDTPAADAAARMSGDFAENLAAIEKRRLDDATRCELPVVRPKVLMRDFTEWVGQFSGNGAGIDTAVPLYVSNGKETTLDNIQYLGGVIAAGAQTLGTHLYHSRIAD